MNVQPILTVLIDLLFTGAGLTACAVIAASLLKAWPAWRLLSAAIKEL